MKPLLVGRFYGVAEEQASLLAGHPCSIVGAAAEVLDACLEQAGLSRAEVDITNVFNERPYSNKEESFFYKSAYLKSMLVELGYKKKHIDEWMRGDPSTPPEVAQYFKCPKFGQMGFLKPEFYHHIERLKNECVGRELIIPLGSTALWAITGRVGISSFRGTFLRCKWGEQRVLATYHPEYILKQYGDRPLVLDDLRKATSNRSPLERTLYVATTVGDLSYFERLFLKERFAFDVEEEGTRQITSFSLAPTPTCCLVVPILDPDGPDWVPYWSREDEVEVWTWLKELSTRCDLTWIMQNCLYDLTQLLEYNIKPRGPIVDTMLLHHAHDIESPKGLGVLGSIYADAEAWKAGRSWAKKKEGKDNS